MVALVERRADVGVTRDASLARDKVGSTQAPERNPVPRAHVGCEPRGAFDDRPAVGVVPAERPLARVAGSIPIEFELPPRACQAMSSSRTHWTTLSASTQ